MGVQYPFVHHVGIVMPRERVALSLIELLGYQEKYRGYVECWSALCIFTESHGSVPMEFVIADSGPLKEWNRGAGGTHHVALAVEDLADRMRQLAERGIRMLEPEPVKGAGPFLCNFIDPASTRGVVIELVQVLPEPEPAVSRQAAKTRD